jgi:phospholipid/cholesterol/gamma-HCH transport system permease protein
MDESRNKPTLELLEQADGLRCAVLGGTWDLSASREALDALLARATKGIPPRHLLWDLRQVERLDHVSAALLWRLWGQQEPAELALRPEHRALFERLAAAPRPETPPTARFAPVLALGKQSIDFAQHLAGIFYLGGQLLLDLLALSWRPRRAPWREWSANLYRSGTTALPITALVGFLIGIVLSYLSAQQLRTVGANVFIVNLLGVSILRELGPLLAALLVAGRSGSSMTAQVGVMRLTQELDALSAMGISHSQRLVLPKVLALATALPLLVLWTNALALWGGMLTARRELGISYQFFISKFPDVVPVSNLWLGLAKGALFGGLIALVACYFGLKVEPNTRSLAAGTTRSVVTAITLVIIADALFAIATSRMGLL